MRILFDHGTPSYRLRFGDGRVIYELHDDRLELWALEVGPSGEIYRCASKLSPARARNLP
jgi:mRNA-degrading endonuclease RelE of RelBE toxin-antitoxin system